nr:hypothetical transcript [Hymenolepis microstoma]
MKCAKIEGEPDITDELPTMEEPVETEKLPTEMKLRMIHDFNNLEEPVMTDQMPSMLKPVRMKGAKPEGELDITDDVPVEFGYYCHMEEPVKCGEIHTEMESEIGEELSNMEETMLLELESNCEVPIKAGCFYHMEVIVKVEEVPSDVDSAMAEEQTTAEQPVLTDDLPAVQEPVKNERNHTNMAPIMTDEPTTLEEPVMTEELLAVIEPVKIVEEQTGEQPLKSDDLPTEVEPVMTEIRPTTEGPLGQMPIIIECDCHAKELMNVEEVTPGENKVKVEGGSSGDSPLTFENELDQWFSHFSSTNSSEFGDTVTEPSSLFFLLFAKKFFPKFYNRMKDFMCGK